jgi:plasmid stabilization system protein ParE
MIPVWSPEAIDDLSALRAYIEQDDPAAAQRVALHIVTNVETLLANKSGNGATRPRAGNARTRDTKDTIHRAVPLGRQHDSGSAHFPRCASMARGSLKVAIIASCAA